MIVSLSDYYGYLCGLAPVVLCHICIPPQSYIVGIEQAPELLELFYHFLPHQFFQKRFYDSLVLDYKDPSPHTWLTHIFLHSDYSHMLHNLEAAVLYGYPVYCEYGAGGLLVSFLCGGVIASIPSYIHGVKPETLGKALASIFPTLESDTSIGTYVPDRIRRAFNNSMVSIAGLIRNSVLPTRCVGSSG